MAFSAPTKHKTRTMIKFNIFRKIYGRKIVYGVMKAKTINVGETKIGKLLSEINPEAQPKRQNFVGRLLNPKVYNANIFVDKIHYVQNEKLGIFRVVRVCMLEMGFPVK